MKPPKMSIIVRKDLNMRRGKSCAQASHAAMKVFFDRMKKVEADPFAFEGNGKDLYETSFTPEMEEWKNGLFTKIVLGCDNEEEIHFLKAKADELGIPAAIIIDSGLTEFGGVPTITCIALGPYKAEVLEELTSKYSLL